MRIGQEASRLNFRALAFDELGSTNDEAMARARAGEAGGLWLVARRQTGGRGRHGRPWSSPPGNLHASLLLVDACPPSAAPQLGFVAGVALIDALHALAPALPFALKWPNDVLCAGGKLAGVLVEGAMLAGGGFACVVGFGVNCAHHPADLPYRGANLAEHGAAIGPEDLAPALADAMSMRLEHWAAGAGFASIREAWLARAAGLGAPIEARMHSGVQRGVFETIDADGRLVLARADGTRVLVEAADVFPTLCAPGGAITRT